MAYRNVKYDHKTSTMHLWTWDKDGNRVKKEVTYKPFVLIEDENGTHRGVDGKSLRKIPFNTSGERNKFVDNYSGQIYNNLFPEQQFLVELLGHVSIDDLVEKPLRTFYLDIECPSPKNFPEPSEAAYEINLLTIYDSFTKIFHVFGIGKYDKTSVSGDIEGVLEESIVYHESKTEVQLLNKFLNYWKHNTPDLIVTWNGMKFDIPYIVQRLKNVFGESKPKALSPIGSVTGKEVVDLKFGAVYTEYSIAGVSHIDYMKLFRYYSANEVESDKLDYVAEEKLKVKKVSYEGSLWDLSMNDWNKYTNYNIQDVNLMVLLEEQQNYLKIARYSACAGLCNMEKAMGKLAIVGGAIAKTAKEKHNTYIPTKNNSDQDFDKIEGGYVKEVTPGLYKNIVSYDANSLYPSCIITMNISPEKKVGRVLNISDVGDMPVSFELMGREYVYQKEKFISFVKKNKLAISSANIIFDQREKGVIPEFVDYLYDARKEAQNEMTRLENIKGDKTKIGQLDRKQYLYKILLNSIYGALANKHFIMFDQDCARSITLTGQAMITKTQDIVNSMFEKAYDLPPKDRVVAIDTDSNYISFDDILKKKNITALKGGGELTDEFKVLDEQIKNHINTKIEEWARKRLFSLDPRFVFKREAVCATALWVKKKNYILHVVNNESVVIDKIKISGLRVKKAIFSKPTKKIILDIIDTLMKDATEKAVNTRFKESFKLFKKLDLADVALKSNIKTFEKYNNLSRGVHTSKGTPYHIKAAIYFNYMVERMGLDGKYEKISSGDKVSIVTLHKNPYNIPTLAYKNNFPEEFSLEVDVLSLFKKSIEKQMKAIYDAVGWHMPDVTKQYCVDLDELLG